MAALSGQVIEPPHNLQALAGPDESSRVLRRTNAAAVRYVRSGTAYTDTLAAGARATLYGGTAVLFDTTRQAFVTFILPANGGSAVLYATPESNWAALSAAVDAVPLDLVVLHEVRRFQLRTLGAGTPPPAWTRPPFYPPIPPRLVPYGESWQGGSSSAGDLIIPGPSGVGGPAFGCWVYIPASWMHGAGFGGVARTSFAVFDWVGPSTDPAHPDVLTHLSLVYHHDFGGFIWELYYRRPGFGNMVWSIIQTGSGLYSNPADTWLWVAVSMGCNAVGDLDMHLVVTAAGASSPLSDDDAASFNPSSYATFPSPATAGDLALSPGTLHVLDGAAFLTGLAAPAIGPPNDSGILISRLHYVPHFCTVGPAPAPVMAPPSPPCTHFAAGGGVPGERIYNPDGLLSEPQALLLDSSGNHLDLTSTAPSNGLVLQADAPPGGCAVPPPVAQPTLVSLSPNRGSAAGGSAAPTLSALSPAGGPASGLNTAGPVLTALSPSDGPPAGGN